MKQLCFTAFDHGITHFDLANNYGPNPGSAERNLGRILREELGAYRDELVISTKAGYEMWDGPYGSTFSRASTRAYSAWAFPTLTSSIITVWIPTRRWRKP